MTSSGAIFLVIVLAILGAALFVGFPSSTDIEEEERAIVETETPEESERAVAEENHPTPVEVKENEHMEIRG